MKKEQKELIDNRIKEHQETGIEPEFISQYKTIGSIIGMTLLIPITFAFLLTLGSISSENIQQLPGTLLIFLAVLYFATKRIKAFRDENANCLMIYNTSLFGKKKVEVLPFSDIRDIKVKREVAYTIPFLVVKIYIKKFNTYASMSEGRMVRLSIDGNKDKAEKLYRKLTDSINVSRETGHAPVQQEEPFRAAHGIEL